MGGFPSGQRGQTVNLLAMPSKVRILLRPLFLFIAGWSSLEARRAHNPEVASSNLAPATIGSQANAHPSGKPAGCTMICKCKSSGIQSQMLLCVQAPNEHSRSSTGIRAYQFFRPDSSVGRAEDWKSSCHWFDSGSGHGASKEALFYVKFNVFFSNLLCESYEKVLKNHTILHIM